MQSILVLGTGSWGTAISQVICDNLINEKVKINMYGRDQSKMDELELDLVIIKTAYKILYNYIEPKQAVIDMFDLFNHQV